MTDEFQPKGVGMKSDDIEGRFQALMAQCAALESDRRNDKKRIMALERTAETHTKQLALVDESRANRLLAGLGKRLAEISEQVQVCLTKQIVVGEVLRLYPADVRAVVVALDYPTDWWVAPGTSALTIRDWHERLNQALKAPVVARLEPAAASTH